MNPLGPLDGGEAGFLHAGVPLDEAAVRSAEGRVRAAEQHFQCAFEGSPVGIALLDLDFRLVQVNVAFCDVIGYPAEQLAGTRLEAIIHPGDGGRDREAMLAELAGVPGGGVIHTRLIHALGHELTVEVRMGLLCDADGAPLGVLGHFQDVTVRDMHERQLAYLADHDALTGLLNRHAFHRELVSHAALADRYGSIGAVLVIDLDHFKFVNDTLGHLAGDELIVRSAELLRMRLRSSDVLARLGGDEFGVLLPHAGPSAATRVGRTLLEALGREGIQIDGLARPLTASVGIASFEDRKGITGDEMLVNADLAMYDAKEAGRDRIAHFRSPDHSEARSKGRITWVHRIQAALAHDQMTLLAQPIVHLASGNVSQYELLLRMRDDHGDLIPPATFLHVAERLELIGQIDTWVISRAISMLADPDVRASGVAFEVNLSGASIGDCGLLEHIESELATFGVDPARVIFEITETAALGSMTRARAFGERLSRIGCRFALDDFGAGFGSFHYLKHLHFDLIKIDGEFVSGCAASSTDQLLIAAIVDIAGGLGADTVAEYVPDEETVQLLCELGVVYGQGNHLGRPAPLPLPLPPALPVALPMGDEVRRAVGDALVGPPL